MNKNSIILYLYTIMLFTGIYFAFNYAFDIVEYVFNDNELKEKSTISIEYTVLLLAFSIIIMYIMAYRMNQLMIQIKEDKKRLNE